MPGLTGFFGNAWRLDALFAAIIVAPIKAVAGLISGLIDKLLIDGTVNGAAAVAKLVGEDTRTLTTGSVKSYAVWMGCGAALLSLLLVWI